MNALVGFREKIKKFYAQFSNVLIISGKFLLAVFLFLFINREIGFSPLLTNIFVVLVMALVSSILNIRVMLFLAVLSILGNCYVIGYDVLAVTTALILLLLMMFVWYVPEDAAEAAMMPLSLALGVPALVPICCGLKRTPASIAALWPGVIIHYYITTLGANAEAIASLERGEYMARIKILADAFLTNRMVVVDLFAVTAVVVIVYAIRKLSANFSWEVAAGAGAVLYVVMAVISQRALGVELPMTQIVTGAALSAVFAYIFIFFTHHLDYKRIEQLTFEDEEYYYYVKAIPKILQTEQKQPVEETQQLPEIPAEGEKPADGELEVDFESRLEESLGDL